MQRNFKEKSILPPKAVSSVNYYLKPQKFTPPNLRDMTVFSRQGRRYELIGH